MADQSQTATNKQSEPALCKKGCGFFGNAATGGCCSKCWRDIQNAEKTKSAVAACVVAPSSPAKSPEKAPEKVAPMTLTLPTVDACTSGLETSTTPKAASEAIPTETPAVMEASTTVAAAPAKKKKKKKTSYKNMMASMMKEKSKDDDKNIAKDDAIRKVTGGGAFSKIEKI